MTWDLMLANAHRATRTRQRLVRVRLRSMVPLAGNPGPARVRVPDAMAGTRVTEAWSRDGQWCVRLVRWAAEWGVFVAGNPVAPVTRYPDGPGEDARTVLRRFLVARERARREGYSE